MRTVWGADFEDQPQIDNGLDYALTGWILNQNSGALVTSGLGTLSSTIQVDEQAGVPGPTPVATSGGYFSLTVPIATLQSSQLGLIFITVNSTTAGTKPFTAFLRVWTTSEHNQVNIQKFIVNQNESRHLPSATVQDFYTGLWHPADEIEQVDGRAVAKRMGYKSKQLDQTTNGTGL